MLKWAGTPGQCHILLLIWHAPLGVCSAKRRHQSLSLQSGRFWATSTASFRERLLKLRSCWIVFIHAVRGRPGGLLQFSKGEAVMIFLTPVSFGIHAMWSSREKCVMAVINVVWRYCCVWAITVVFVYILQYYMLGLSTSIRDSTE